MHGHRDGRLDDAGLTLIEVTVVVVILGILAAIVTVAIGDSSEDAARNTCSAQIDAVQAAIRRYVNDGEGRLRDFDSVEDVNTLLIPTYLADQLEQADKFTITITDGVVTGTYGVDNEPCP